MPGTLKKIFSLYAILGFIIVSGIILFYYPALIFIAIQSVLHCLFGAFPSPKVGLYATLASVILSLLAGWLWGAKARLPGALFARLLPLLLPPLLWPTAYIVWTNGPFLLSDSLLNPYMLLLGVIIPCCCFYLVFLIRSERRCPSAAKKQGVACLLGVALVCVGLAVGTYRIATRDLVRAGDEAFVEHQHLMDIFLYWPFRENKLARPASPPSLRIASEYPRRTEPMPSFPCMGPSNKPCTPGWTEKALTKS